MDTDGEQNLAKQGNDDGIAEAGGDQGVIEGGSVSGFKNTNRSPRKGTGQKLLGTWPTDLLGFLP
jgi:hypothetical protein